MLHSGMVLAAPQSGSGKTTITCALLAAMKNRKLAVRAFKSGPDYIDPMFHASALHTPCRNLDLQFLDANMLRFRMAAGSEGFSLAVTEGVMGFYDGVGLTTQASSYEVAKVTGSPVILTVDARGAAHSVLAVIHGFRNLHPDSGIRGAMCPGFRNAP